MRHGAGPMDALRNSQAETSNNFSASMENLSLSNQNESQRLGCYFCNDVVAPIDVRFLRGSPGNCLIAISTNMNPFVLCAVNCQPYPRPTMYSYSSWTCSYCISPCCWAFGWSFASSVGVNPQLLCDIHANSVLFLHFKHFLFNYDCRIYAKAEFANSNDSGSTEQPLGMLPHQIRGSLSQFSQMTLVGHASTCCTACCSTVS